LRNKIDQKTLKIGENHQLNIFFDEENFAFRLKFLGREEIKTKFGKKTCLKFRPLVIADRIFKEDESLTLWVSDDKNKVPVKISAKLVVGTLTANLSKYKGLKFSHGW